MSSAVSLFGSLFDAVGPGLLLALALPLLVATLGLIAAEAYRRLRSAD